MKETSFDIRAAYYELLSGNLGNMPGTVTPIEVYANHLPNGLNEPVYVLISQQQAYNRNTKSSFNTDSTIQLTIISKAPGNNPGVVNDEIADKIYSIIYPSPVGSVVTSTNFQVVSTELVSDIKLEPFSDGQYMAIERVITFQHKTHQIA